MHDFTLCKTSLLVLAVCLSVIILADSGYQGIQSYYAWSLIPIKSSKNSPLSAAEKAYNREWSRRRIVIENINAEIKVFKIMTYLYRNRRESHLLRTKLVCAILNAEKNNDSIGLWNKSIFLEPANLGYRKGRSHRRMGKTSVRSLLSENKRWFS